MVINYYPILRTPDGVVERTKTFPLTKFADHFSIQVWARYISPYNIIDLHIVPAGSPN